jgi:preprotein translocase SecF subunit
MRLLENLHIDFISKRKFAYMFSGTLLILGIISLILRGLELGIDFKGGSEITLQFTNPVNISEVRETVNSIGLGNVEVKTFGGDDGVLLRTELQTIPASVFPSVVETINNIINQSFPDLQLQLIDSTDRSITYLFQDPLVAKDVSKKLVSAGFQPSLLSGESDNINMVIGITIADWLKEILTEHFKDNKFIVLSETQVEPKISGELQFDALIAIFLALMVILIYIGFRFKFAFAVGAVAALFHDVLITIGVFSLLYGVIPQLNLEISVNIVAAFLTLVGYSINDSVVVFDRIREDFKIHKTAPIKQNINSGINKTIRRTLVTSLTTLFVVTVLLIFGGEVLRGFAFTLFLGILVGTYSSIFVASSFVYEYATKYKKKIQF